MSTHPLLSRCSRAWLLCLAILVLGTSGAAAQLQVITVPKNPQDPTVPHTTYPGHQTTFKAIARNAGPTCVYTWDLDDNGTFDDHPPRAAGACAPDGLGSSTCYDLSEPYVPPAVAADTLFDIEIEVTCGPVQSIASYPLLVVADVPAQGDPADNGTSRPQDATDEQLAIMREVAIDDGLWWLHVRMSRSGTGASMSGHFPGPEDIASAGLYLWAAGINGHRAAYPPGTYSGPEPQPGWQAENDARWNDDPYAESLLRAFNWLMGDLRPVPVAPEDEADDGTTPLPGTNDGEGLETADGRTLSLGHALAGLSVSGMGGTTAEAGDPASVRGRRMEVIIQQMVDAVSAYQIDEPTEDFGGWGTTWIPTGGVHDGSTAQWAYIGIEAADVGMRDLGVHIPDRVLRNMTSGLLGLQDPVTGSTRPTPDTCTGTGSYDLTGGALVAAGYLGWPDATPMGANIIAQDGTGSPITDGQVRQAYERALQFVTDRYYLFQGDCTGAASGPFNNNGGTDPAPYLRTDNEYSMYSIYSVQKGLRTLKPELRPPLLGSPPSHDWEREYYSAIIRRQAVDGSFRDTTWSTGDVPRTVVLGEDLTTLYGVMVLTPTVFKPNPVAACVASGEVDADGDGFCVAGGDCDDTDPLVFPGAHERCDGRDNDCDGIADEGLDWDLDGDGATRPGSCQGSADDCDDTSPERFVGNPEVCDGVDNDCDGVADQGLSTDADNDGHFTPASCQTPNDDCDDLDETSWNLPTPVEGLTLEHDAALRLTRLSWTPPADPGSTEWSYDVIRGVQASDLAGPGAVCLETNDLDEEATDPDDPPLGGLQVYAVAPENGCGRATPGFRSDGSGRVGLDCTLPQPVASFDVNPNPAACGQPVSVDAGASFHPTPGVNIHEYRWDWDDGTSEITAGPLTTHAFDRFGTFDVVLTVVDDQVPRQQASTNLIVEVDQGNNPPAADANGPYAGELGQAVVLDGSRSRDPDGACGDRIVGYEWDLNNDGVYDFTVPAPETVVPWNDIQPLAPWPTDPASGQPSQVVRLRVTDSLGLQSESTSTLRVYDNQPFADLVANPNPAVCNQPVNLDASGSRHGHPDRVIVDYAWDFGDGNGVPGGPPVLDHVYSSGGTFRVRVTVTDDNAPPRQDFAEVDVDVGCTPPAVSAFDVSGGEGDVVVLDGRFNDPDPGDFHVAEIEWGDGTPPEPAVVDPALQAVFGTHAYGDDDVYSVTLRVVDTSGHVGETIVQAQIFNQPPTVDAGQTATSTAFAPFELLADFNDKGTQDTHTAIIDWGDGTPPEPGFVSESPYGPPGDPSGVDGTVQATHIFILPGVYTVEVCVIDDDGASTCDRLEVHVGL